MQANKPYISTGLRHIFAIVSSQISTMMEPSNAILKLETTNRRYKISPRDISFLSSLSIIHVCSNDGFWKRYILHLLEPYGGFSSLNAIMISEITQTFLSFIPSFFNGGRNFEECLHLKRIGFT